MKLSWMFGPSMAQQHLLYAYVVVWVVQGGYAAWVAWQWWGARSRSSVNTSQKH